MRISRSLAVTTAVILLAGMGSASFAGEEPSFFNGFNVQNGLIKPEAIDHGGPGRDGIPALDSPRFLVGADRDFQVKLEDRVMGVSFNGVAKAYPINILEQHEIVNDRFDGTALTITFCPLCGTGMVFFAKVRDQVLDFGVSGLIYNSDMLLYDRSTKSLWSQVMKTAVTGPLKGETLTQIPAQYTTWGSWLKQYPDSLLLSRDTGFRRDYDAEPYYDYKRLPIIVFSTSHQDHRLSGKDWIVGIAVGDAALALPFTELDKLEGSLQVNVGDTELDIQWDRAASAARVFDRDGSEIPATSAYWFAWVAFHPDTALYQMDAGKQDVSLGADSVLK